MSSTDVQWSASPEEANAHLRACEILIRDGEYVQAEMKLNEYLHIIDLPDSLRARACVDIAEIRWRTGHYADAIENAENGVSLAARSGDVSLEARAHSVLGIACKRIGEYGRAIEQFSAALSLDESNHAERNVGMNLSNVGSVYHELEDYERALEYYLRSIAVHEKFNNKSGIAISYGNIADVSIATKDFEKAIDFAQRARAIDIELRNTSRLGKQCSTTGLAHMGLGEYAKAREQFLQAIEIHEGMGNFADAALDYCNLAFVYSDEGSDVQDLDTAEKYLLKGIDLAGAYDVKKTEAALRKCFAEILAKQGRWKEAYESHQRYHELDSMLSKSETMLSSIRFDYQRKTAEREKHIAVERANHESTLNLLHNVLPPSIALRMVAGESLIAEKISDVSVLFADIVDFTKYSANILPEELVEGLDKIFSDFDALADKYSLEKIKTIGDAYMVVAGAPEARPDHAGAMARMALDMIEVMNSFRSDTSEGSLQIRIGIHCGEVVAGVIGKKKFAYDLWGDTVNTASRMESSGEPGKIHCSSDFVVQAQKRDQTFAFKERGEIEIKGKGMMRTHFLERV